MSQQAESAHSQGAGMFARIPLIGAVVVGILAVSEGPAGFHAMERQLVEGHLHAPNLSLLAHAPMLLQLHLATVLLGFTIGAVQMLGEKGTTMHRLLGWTFVVFMMFTALDALFIKDGPTWRVTPIQLFSLIVLIGLPFAVLAARRHNVAAHARGMTGIYFGGLVLAGILTFTPGRLIWRVFFG